MSEKTNIKHVAMIAAVVFFLSLSVFFVSEFIGSGDSTQLSGYAALNPPGDEGGDVPDAPIDPDSDPQVPPEEGGLDGGDSGVDSPYVPSTSKGAGGYSSPVTYSDLGTTAGGGGGGSSEPLQVQEDISFEYNLSDADFILNGFNENGSAGYSVASGDVDGDGYSDVIIGAYMAETEGKNNSGQVYVFKGSADNGTYNLNETAYYTLNGIDDDDYAGYSVASGDVDDDGKDDVIIGAYTADPDGRNLAGEVYVFKGGQANGTYNLSDSSYYTLNGIDDTDYAGSSVASGDVDGDGKDDVIIGAYSADPNGHSKAGEVYVFKGGQTNGTYDLNTSSYYILNGIDVDDLAGIVVSSGDVDVDGNDDVIIGATGANPDGRTDAGEVYVFKGGQTNGTYNLNISSYYILNGVDSYDLAGQGISSGDVDGDGKPDIIIGANYADPDGDSRAGEVYVFSSSHASGTYDLDTDSFYTLNGIDVNDEAGWSVSSGDVNNDGFADVIIGAPYGDPNGDTDAGEVYVVYGQDVFAPAIAFIDPTPKDDAVIGTTWNYVNVSASDSGDLSVILDWNSSLRGWWRLEESGTTVIDSSSFGNDGTYLNGPVSVSGIRGNARDFDGDDDYVKIVDPNSINFSDGSFTISYWLNPETLDDPVETQIRPMEIAGCSGGAYMASIFGSTAGDTARLDFFAVDSDSVSETISSAADALSKNEWQMYTIVIDRTNDEGKGYVNGVPGSTIALDFTGDFNCTDANVYLGGFGTNWNFNGSMDDLMIWNRVLSSQEINATYQAGTYRLETNLTDLADGDYNYTAYAVDAAGNLNSTSQRTVTVDTVYPSAAFVSPTYANDTVTVNDWAYVNVSASDTNDISAFIDWDRSLVGWWRLEEASGSTTFDDQSSWNNDGSCSGGTCPTKTTGQRGGAYEFDGEDDYVLVSDDDSLNFGEGAFTVALWARSDQVDGALKIFLAKGIAGGPTYPEWLWQQHVANKWRFVLSNGTDLAVVDSDNIITEGRWYHLAAVRETDGAVKIYVDGDLQADSELLAGNVSNTRNFVLGGRSNLDSYWFNGSMDDVLLLDRALSAEEINATYNAGTYRLEKNFTSLAGGDYTYTAYVEDAAGNVNSTEERTLTINSVPQLDSLTLNATNATNFTIENLTAHTTTSDGDGDDMTVVYDWRLNGVSDALFNVPFDVNGSNENTTNVKDYVTSQHNGSLGGGVVNDSPVWNSSCGAFTDSGGCYEFDGINDNIEFYYDFPESDLTVSVWFKANEVIGTGMQIIYDRFYGRMTLHLNNNQAVFRVANETTQFTAPTGLILQEDQWYHLAGTIDVDTKTFKIYLNGIYKNENTYEGDIYFGNPAYVTLGAYYRGAGAEHFNGSIDQFNIWNRTFTDDEIAALYDGGAGKYDVLHSDATSTGDVWSVAASVFDEYEEGNTLVSNDLTILGGEAAIQYIGPLNDTEIIRGKTEVSNEDPESHVPDVTTLQARVYDVEDNTTGVSANCSFYFAGSLLGVNTTNSGGYCNYTFDHTGYSAGDKAVFVNFTSTDPVYDLNATGADVTRNLKIVVYEVALEKTNQRGTGAGYYLQGDAAILEINVTKDGTPVDVNSMTVETRRSSPNALIATHNYPGDIVRTGVGNYYSLTVINDSFGAADVHWNVYVNDNQTIDGAAQATVIPASSGSHSDVDIRAATSTLNLTMVGGDGNVLDNTAITLYDRNLYQLEDDVLTTGSATLVRDGAQNDHYDVNYETDDGLTFRLREFNVTLTDFMLSPQVVESYTGSVPSGNNELSDVFALNTSGFTFGNATITIPLESVSAVQYIYHCTDWDFSSADCNSWEQNDTSDYADYTINATHFSFTVTSFTAYAGGSGYSSQIGIWDQNDTGMHYGDQPAEIDTQIYFFANYTNFTSGSPITGADCAITFSDSSNGDMTYNATKELFEYTRTFSSPGTRSWNVTCNMTGYDTLNATDSILIAGETERVDRQYYMAAAQVTKLNTSRLPDAGPGNDSATAGNVTDLDLGTNTSTAKWQGYYGEVSATLRLGNADSDIMYDWGSVMNDQIKTVFAATDSDFNFANFTASTGGEVDTVYNWTTTDTDSGTNTFDEGEAVISGISGVPVVNLTAYDGGVQDNTIYHSAAFKDDGNVILGAYGALAFGANVVPDKTAFNNVTQIDYELIVAVNSSGQAGTQTYYFFMDIE